MTGAPISRDKAITAPATAGAVEPNTQEALDFLVKWCGDEPIVLTAIVPDGGPVESETFRPQSEAEACRAWIDGLQGKRNIYFTVNATSRPIRGRNKARKTDIRGMRALHVDIDPRPGEDMAEEREKAVASLRGFNPPPTAIIASGGGFQGFWVLDKEYRTDGSEEKAAELEAYNQQFCVVIGGDNCWNIDRIMRLPGTINIPDAKKRKKGRVEALAKLVEWTGARNPLTAFTPAPTLSRARVAPAVQAEAPTVGALGEERLRLLPGTVSEAVKDLLRRGHDPERFPTRSEALMSATCSLVSADCEREAIIGILLDPSLGISESVREKPKPRKYAERQVERAAAFIAGRPFRALTDMGNAHLLVDLHGHDLLHCYPQKSWYVWDGCRWVRDDGHRVDRLVKDIPGHLLEEARRLKAAGKDGYAKLVAGWAQKSQSRERLRAISEVARSEVPVDPADLDANPLLLNVDR